MSDCGGYAPLADVVRNGLVESRHFGSVSVVREGRQVAHVGDTAAVGYARSALKPFQLTAMLDAGLATMPWSSEHLAVMASSHSGQVEHCDLVRSILAAAGLDERALQNTPALPMAPQSRLALRAAGVTGKASLYADCSGKHAAMLATCVVNGWPIGSYLDPEHPLQQVIRAGVEQMTGEAGSQVAVDGCGAPLFSGTLAGLARGYCALAQAEPQSAAGRVAVAMRSHPVLVAGRDRDVTKAMVAVPGLVAKDGAEGVLGATVVGADGLALGVAVKVADGAARPRAVVLAAVLAACGLACDTPEWAKTPVLGGGRVVGEVRSAMQLLWETS